MTSLQEEKSMETLIRAFDTNIVNSNTKIIKPWKTKIFRLIRNMDISQIIDSDLIHGCFILIMTLQILYYIGNVFVDLCFTISWQELTPL